MLSSDKAPRIGKEYQVDIPEWSGKPEKNGSHGPEGHRECVWKADVLEAKEVDEFLRFGQRLFENGLLVEDDYPVRFCEARGLYLLKQLDFDISKATEILRPLPAVSEVLYDDESDENCWICNEGGDVLMCDYPECLFVYHTSCLGMETIPEGDWHCRRHNCLVCKKDLGNAPKHVCQSCSYAYCENDIPAFLLGHPEFFCEACSVESNRTKEIFYKRLKQVHSKTRKQELRVPHIHGHEVDLHKLYRLVISRGGLEKILSKPQWLEVVKSFDFDPNDGRTSTRLLECYKDILLDYERKFFDASAAWNGETDVSGKAKEQNTNENDMEIEA